MNQALLLVVEGKHADHPAFAPALRKKGYEVEVVLSGSQALARLQQGLATDAVVVNAASLRTSGKRICQALRDKEEELPIVLILDQETALEETSANVTLNLPFTVQKLANRIRNLLPGDGKNSIQAGPIRLDVENHTVRCLGRQTRLTPRLVALLRVLIDRRGEVVERKALFSKVWETDYTDDHQRSRRMTHESDALVVGGGIHGLSAALHLARMGKSVTVLERRYSGRHSSGVNAGGERTLGRDLAEVPLSVPGMALWHGIRDLVGDDCGFRAQGFVRVAESDGEVESLLRRRDRVRAIGYTHEEVIDQAELRRVLPAIAPHCVAGLICRSDGAADPFRTTQAFRRAAIAAGLW